MVRQATAGLLDLLLPPLCVRCREPVAAHQALCGACWRQLHFIETPYCARCGAPFSFPVEAGTLCASCLEKEPAFGRARSAILYDEASRDIVLGFKHGDRLHHVPAMAAWMRRAGETLWAEADLIVPVPLHSWRLFLRRYNQAALLALAVGDLVGKDVCVDALQRVRATSSQGHLPRQARQSNVAGAMRVPSSRTQKVQGKRIVLIDDVLTTGATANECCRVLRKAGAAQVDVLTLMRANGG